MCLVMKGEDLTACCLGGRGCIYVGLLLYYLLATLNSPTQDSSWANAQPNTVTCHRPLNLRIMLVTLISALGALSGRITPEPEALLTSGRAREGADSDRFLLDSPQLSLSYRTQPPSPLPGDGAADWPHHHTAWDAVSPPSQRLWYRIRWV